MAGFLKGPPLPLSLGYTVCLLWTSFYLIVACHWLGFLFMEVNKKFRTGKDVFASLVLCAWGWWPCSLKLDENNPPLLLLCGVCSVTCLMKDFCLQVGCDCAHLWRSLRAGGPYSLCCCWLLSFSFRSDPRAWKGCYALSAFRFQNKAERERWIPRELCLECCRVLWIEVCFYFLYCFLMRSTKRCLEFQQGQ